MHYIISAKLHENVKIPSNIAKLILEMEKIEVSNKKAVDLSLWDTSGQVIWNFITDYF